MRCIQAQFILFLLVVFTRWMLLRFEVPQPIDSSTIAIAPERTSSTTCVMAPILVNDVVSEASHTQMGIEYLPDYLVSEYCSGDNADPLWAKVELNQLPIFKEATHYALGDWTNILNPIHFELFEGG